MLRTALLLLVVWTSAFAADVNPATYLDDVRYLASDRLKGRATGSPEIELAAQYIADQFKSFGLKPVPGTTNYEQEFTATTSAKLGPANRLTATLSGRTETLNANRGFVPFSFSSTGTGAAAPVVFVGYGITAADYHYDDYAGIDVKDKYVVMLRHEPQENDENSVFEGKKTTTHAQFTSKATNARNHGARGVIIVSDSFHHPGERDQLVKFGTADGPPNSGVFFVQATTNAVDQWLKPSGHTLRELAADIDRDLNPESFVIPNLTVAMNVEILREEKPAHNVLAYLPGQTDEYVIIGAHYDHLGLGNEFSLAPSKIGEIHHGADDNASGTAGVIELARYFSKQSPPDKPTLKRGILFMTFAGEELGLLGSGYFASHPLLPLEKTVAMLNMDMIGRVSSGKIYVNGTGTGSTLPEIVNSTPVPTGLKIDLSDSVGYGGSDHMSFQAKQVPVIFFFSGLHADYHKPSDTADKINAKDAALVVDYVADIATKIANAQDRPVFQRVAEKSDPHSGGTPTTSGYGPNFGSVPDFNEPPKGVRFADVKKGTPADKAGLKPGDILVAFDGKEISNLYDFTYALQSHKPGDEVLVTVLRGSQRIEAKVLLTERR
jgi:hypothetical protein